MASTGRQRELTIGLFFVYILALVWIILFKFQLSLDTLPDMRTINLIPFYDAGEKRVSASVGDIVWNTLAFIPFGMYVCMLRRDWPFARKLAPIFLISLAFEAAQYVFGIGASDINDLILNTLGGCVGIGVYYAMERIFGERSGGVLRALALVGTVLMIVLIGVLSRIVTYRF